MLFRSAHVETAIRVNTESSMALTVKGDILLSQDDLAGAGKAFGEAVKRSPGNARAISGYAIAMAKQNKNLNIALSFARESVALDSKSTLYRERLETIQAICDPACDPDQAQSA